MRHWSQLGIRNWRAKPGRTAGGLAIGLLGRRTVDRETATGTILALSTALGILFASMASEGAAAVTDVLFGSTGPRGGQRDGVAQLVFKSAVRTVGSAIGREIVRGVMGGLLGGSQRKR